MSYNNGCCNIYIQVVFNETYHKIEIITTPNQDSPWTVHKTPLLGIDMWEHAYFLDYTPAEKKKYIEAFFENLNWEIIEANFTKK